MPSIFTTSAVSVVRPAQSIRGLYIKPKADYWSFYNRDPDISADEPNVVTLRALSEWPPMAGFPQQQTAGWGQKAMRMDQLPANFRGQGPNQRMTGIDFEHRLRCRAEPAAGGQHPLEPPVRPAIGGDEAGGAR